MDKNWFNNDYTIFFAHNYIFINFFTININFKSSNTLY